MSLAKQIRLEAVIRAVCPPIHGVSISTATTPPTVAIDYRPEATTAQRQAAADALAAFDWSDTAQQAWERQQAVTRAISVTFTGLESSQVSDRVTLQYLATSINNTREAIALLADGHAADALSILTGTTPANRREDVRLLQPAIVAGLLAAVAAGAGDPVTP